MRRRKPRPEPMRCKCMPGADTPRAHGRPGNHTADHGNPFTHAGACIHSDLSRTTKPMPKASTVKRLRFV